MKKQKKGRKGRSILALLTLALGCFCLLFGRSLGTEARARLSGAAPAGETPLHIPASDSRMPDYSFQAPEESPEASPSPNVTSQTAEGKGVTVFNRTDYSIDTQALLAEPLNLKLQSDAPQILILHTHGSEAYTPDAQDNYTPTDPYRTEDLNYNMVRVGDALEAALVRQGFQVIHDRTLYDYPSYNGSYTRSLEAAQAYLEAYPSIQLVLDIHRDAALLEDGSAFKTTVEIEGKSCSQVMLCVGTDESGLEHPNWRENLKLALRLQSALCAVHPDLARPISLVSSRYNQHLAPGALIVEVGYNGNSLQEALGAIGYFAQAAGDVLQGLY